MDASAQRPPVPALDSAESFATLRSFLGEIGFTEEGVCKRLGLPGELELQALRSAAPASAPPTDALDLMARLFIVGDAFEQGVVARLLPEKVRDALSELALLDAWRARPGWLSARAVVYPIHGVLIASDRWSHPNRAPFQSFDDIVFPAISPNTRRFLDVLPDGPCERFLDLCSGTGVAALVAAKSYARHAWAADLTPRCTAFTEFNRRLNALENVAVVEGDLYQPVRGLTFDRIVAHPPYMPTLQAAEVYYDGGQDGDAVVSRIVQQAPQYLAPGGRLYCLTLGSDREHETFEQRIRVWLGAAGAGFHLAVVARRFVDPSQFALGSALQTGGGTLQADQWKAFLRQRKIRSLVYGMVVLERPAREGPAFTVRRAIGAESTRAETEWLLRWEAAAKDAAAVAQLLETSPNASERFDLRVTHRMREGELVPAEFLLSIEYPFSLECAVPPWTGFLLAACDGARTGRQLYDYCLEKKFIHPETPPQEFAALLVQFVSGGFLESELCPLPKHRGPV